MKQCQGIGTGLQTVSNVMGAAKRIAELYFQRYAATSTLKYACVRLGNILGSRGSVVPNFQKQIADGGPCGSIPFDRRHHFEIR